MDQSDQVAIEATETIETAPVETPETHTEAKPEAPKAEVPKETPEQKVARLSRQLKQAQKQAGIEEEPKPTAKTGELDDTKALLLEVKGLKEDDEVQLFNKWEADTGRKARDILGSKIFQAELAELRQQKATEAAIPSGNGRGGGGGAVNLDSLVEKFERTGELPKDFELKNKVINAAVDRQNTNLPPWRR